MNSLHKQLRLMVDSMEAGDNSDMRLIEVARDRIIHGERTEEAAERRRHFCAAHMQEAFSYLVLLPSPSVRPAAEAQERRGHHPKHDLHHLSRALLSEHVVFIVLLSQKNDQQSSSKRARGTVWMTEEGG